MAWDGVEAWEGPAEPRAVQPWPAPPRSFCISVDARAVPHTLRAWADTSTVPTRQHHAGAVQLGQGQPEVLVPELQVGLVRLHSSGRARQGSERRSKSSMRAGHEVPHALLLFKLFKGSPAADCWQPCGAGMAVGASTGGCCESW